ncbi:MAG: ImmA/IrrE family metallo-endopeptidase [Dehalococcoidia bacterium]|nr:ImmA/IrrE family metallo-endopeptidase [Dehalococcoidia bacterium]
MEILAEHGTESAPVDVEEIARWLGLSVVRVSAAASFSGRLVRDRLLLEVNRGHHPHRQRFTIGHEIGHFVLNHSAVNCVFDDRSWGDPTMENESQAQSFSAALLMPEPWIRSKFRPGMNYKTLAIEFETSPEAMWRRLDELDLLGLERPIRQARVRDEP